MECGLVRGRGLSEGMFAFKGGWWCTMLGVVRNLNGGDSCDRVLRRVW